MPKLLLEPKKRILEAAKMELYGCAPAQFSMRVIAKRAGVAVGTLYHYFADKLSLIGALILSDWESSYRKAEEKANSCRTLDELIATIYDLVVDFSDEHKQIFDNYKDPSFPSYYLKLRPILLSQISSLWQKGLISLNIESNEESFFFVPEIILIASKEEKISKEALIKTIKKIL